METSSHPCCVQSRTRRNCKCVWHVSHIIAPSSKINCKIKYRLMKYMKCVHLGLSLICPMCFSIHLLGFWLNNCLFVSALFRDGVCYIFAKVQRTFSGLKIFLWVRTASPLLTWQKRIVGDASKVMSFLKGQNTVKLQLDYAKYNKKSVVIS